MITMITINFIYIAALKTELTKAEAESEVKSGQEGRTENVDKKLYE